MEKCACKGFFLERFVQPAILMHLAAGSHHGFSLLKKLADESYIPGEGTIDPTGLYRTLKKWRARGCWCPSGTPRAPLSRGRFRRLPMRGVPALLTGRQLCITTETVSMSWQSRYLRCLRVRISPLLNVNAAKNSYFVTGYVLFLAIGCINLFLLTLKNFSPNANIHIHDAAKAPLT